MLPARAGMVPGAARCSHLPHCAPRSRGDGPSAGELPAVPPMCSPLARGWSCHGDAVVVLDGVLPARAGMVPPRPARPCHRCGCSPLARGWSGRDPPEPLRVRVLPARAGMVRIGSTRFWVDPGAPRSRGDGPGMRMPAIRRLLCSPLARGWSQPEDRPRRGARVLPARAGMVRRRRRGWRGRGGAPRSRGDGPLRAGGRRGGIGCSPLARGWSRRHRPRLRRGEVLPARAGMVRACCVTLGGDDRAPRSRGDGPGQYALLRSAEECSPLARGWSSHRSTCRGRGMVLPARAGMVRSQCCHRCPSTSAPRSRGDGPGDGAVLGGDSECSPLARGWSSCRYPPG